MRSYVRLCLSLMDRSTLNNAHYETRNGNAQTFSLTPHQLYAILQARSAVFVVEQNCPYLDAEFADLTGDHLCAWTEDQQLAAIYALCRRA